jgi:hypothetical protein
MSFSVSHRTKTDDGDAQPYTTYFPRADIHELITPDLLHQAIKGVYKDHLVSWVAEYLQHYHGTADMEQILDEIDRRSVHLKIFHLTRSPNHCTGLHLRPHSQDYDGLNKGGISTNGPCQEIVFCFELFHLFF